MYPVFIITIPSGACVVLLHFVIVLILYIALTSRLIWAVWVESSPFQYTTDVS